jgi:hypothetical protein
MIAAAPHAANPAGRPHGTKKDPEKRKKRLDPIADMADTPFVGTEGQPADRGSKMTIFSFVETYEVAQDGREVIRVFHGIHADPGPDFSCEARDMSHAIDKWHDANETGPYCNVVFIEGK